MTITPAYLIRSRRLEHGLTQRQLAEGLCDRGNLGHYECARMIPSEEKAILLADRLGIEREYMLMVVAAQRKIEALLRSYTRRGQYYQAVDVLREMSRREMTPIIRRRYMYFMGEFTKMYL